MPIKCTFLLFLRTLRRIPRSVFSWKHSSTAQSTFAVSKFSSKIHTFNIFTRVFTDCFITHHHTNSVRYERSVALPKFVGASLRRDTGTHAIAIRMTHAQARHTSQHKTHI